MKKFVTAVAAGVSGALAAVPSFAATDITVDYTTAASGILSQATTAITAALPVLGAIVGVTIGVRIFKKFAK